MDRISKVILRGDVKGLQASLAVASRSVQDVVSRMNAAEKQSARTQTSFRQFARVAVTSTAALGIAKVIKDSVTLEAAYSKTMAQVAVATQAPKNELKSLDDLALKLGQDTVFSAQDAASAMLELAKGGLTTAQIKAGALKDTLTLAAAGGLDLGTAAGTVVNAMGAFQLKASETSGAVAALAGAANASSSDVSDITQALAQAGTSAHAAGLTIQETGAYLALFSNQALKGSDAGTSFRTFLTRLVPQTDQARAAMKALNLTYVDQNGKLVDAEEIARRTQKAFKGKSDAERIAAVNTIFGTDAQRAVNAITAEGVTGLRKYEKSTNDLSQAQKLAKAANSGTAGSLENLKGSIETAEIKIGRGLAPTIQKLSEEAANFAQSGDLERWASEGGDAFLDFLHQVQPLAESLGDLAQTALPAVQTAGEATIGVLELAAEVIKPLVDGFNDLPDAAQKALILAAGAKTLSSRLGPLPGLSSSAGGGLLTFGGNAKKGGDDAAKGAKGFGNLAGALKANALLIGAGFVLPTVAADLDSLKSQLNGTGEDVARFTDTFDEAGKKTAKSVDAIRKSLGESDIGRYAKDFGINLDDLATDLAKNGKQGEYFQTVMAKLKKEGIDTSTMGNRAERLKQSFSSFFDPTDPFQLPDFGKALDAKKALDELADAFDDTSDAARKSALSVDEAQNGYTLLINGFGKYLNTLKELPSDVVTKITTPGAVKSQEDVLKLAEQYDLTPEQVKTIMKALDFAKPVIKDVMDALKAADGTGATVTLTTVQQTIKETLTAPKKSDPHATLKEMADYQPPKKKKGKHSADGGPISGPGGPREDLIPAWLSNGEYVVKSAAVDKYGVGFFDSLNTMRFASGGLVDDGMARYDAYQAMQRSTALDLAHQRQEVLSLEKRLRETETVGKGKGKHKRKALRGYDRHVAELELAKAKSDLAKMKADNIALKAYGSDDQEQALYDTAQARSSAASGFAENFSIGSLSSTSAVDHRLTQMIANASTFTALLSDLKAKGASPWLLAQLVQAGPTPTAIRLARQYDTDSAALASINSKAAVFDQLSSTYANLVSDPRFAASGAWSSGIAAPAPAPMTASLVGAEVAVGENGLLHFVKGQIVMAQDAQHLEARFSN